MIHAQPGFDFKETVRRQSGSSNAVSISSQACVSRSVQGPERKNPGNQEQDQIFKASQTGFNQKQEHILGTVLGL